MDGLELFVMNVKKNKGLKMKFKTFKGIVNTIVEIHDINYEKEKKIEEAFGGDSQITTNETGIFMDKLIKILATDSIKDNDEKSLEEAIDWIDYLIYENLLNTDYDKEKDRIFIKNKKSKEIAYPATIKVVWKILHNKI
jgi:hypothetical protein